MTTQTLHRAELTAADRCDRCGAQAFIRARLSAGDLLFCGHHGRAYADGLAEHAVFVEDHTAAIRRPAAERD